MPNGRTFEGVREHQLPEEEAGLRRGMAYESAHRAAPGGLFACRAGRRSFISAPFYGSEDSPIYTLDQAFTFALTPNLQIDFGGNFGLNSISPRNQVYAGISQRF
jgi:hypothetical protein